MNDIIAFVIGTLSSLVAAIVYIYLIARKTGKFKSFRFNKIDINILAIIIAAMTTIVGIATAFSGTEGILPYLNKTKMDIKSDEIIDLHDKLNILLTRIDSIEQKSISITKDSLSNADILLAEILKLKNDVESNKNNIERFEGLLLTDAEELITLPLLKNNIEGLRNDISSLKININSQTSLIQEMQAQNRWIIGTLGLGILALLIPVVKSSFGSTNKQLEEGS